MSATSFSATDFKKKREKMVFKHLKKRGIIDKKVLESFLEVPREKFVPEKYEKYAYDDRPLPISEDQTISQPYIVAEMIQALNLSADDKVLEIGTGSGYAAAILSRIVDKVFGIERHESLVDGSLEKLEELGYDNIFIKVGDGSKGWPEKSPYDGIMVSAAARQIPEPLLSQISEGRRLVLPIGNRLVQKLVCFENKKEGIKEKDLGRVRFVPLITENDE